MSQTDTPRDLSRGQHGSARSLMSDVTGSQVDEVNDSTQKPPAKQASYTSDQRRELQAQRESQKKKGEHVAKHEKLLARREQDTNDIKERAERARQNREKRFEEMMRSVTDGDVHRVEASKLVKKYEQDAEQRRLDTYRVFDSEVNQRVEKQVRKYLTNVETPPIILPDGSLWREELRASDGAASGVHDLKREADFHRKANLIIHGVPRLNLEGLTLKDRVQARDQWEAAIVSRERTRPVLNPELWEQRQLDSSPYGYFAQVCEKGPGFRQVRRAGPGVHLPDETDGVMAAGKVKHRNERHLMPMLDGDLAKQGQSAREKRSHGASCGAPCQDHFFYERGNTICDAEFPFPGRRCFPHLKH